MSHAKRPIPESLVSTSYWLEEAANAPLASVRLTRARLRRLARIARRVRVVKSRATGKPYVALVVLKGDGPVAINFADVKALYDAYQRLVNGRR